MENYIEGKYTITKDTENKKLIIAENTNKTDKEPDIMDIDISNAEKDLIDYSISAFELLTEGSLNNKVVMYSDCNHSTSEIIMDKLPYETLEFNKDYLRIVVNQNNEPLTIFLDIKTLCNEYNG